MAAQHPYQRALANLNLNENGTEIQQLSSLDKILKGSRNASDRVWLADPNVCSYLMQLSFYHPVAGGQYPRKVQVEALRCLTNMIAHDDDDDVEEYPTSLEGHMQRSLETNMPVMVRNRVLETPEVPIALADMIKFGSAQNQEGDYERASIAIRTCYNLCVNYQYAQVVCLKSNMDRAVLEHIYACLSTLRHDTLEVAVELLGFLTSEIKDSIDSPEYDKPFVNQVLRLPCVEDVDDDLFSEMVTSIAPYFGIPQFQSHLFASEQLTLAFDLLETCAFTVSSQQALEKDASSEQTVVRALSDVSAMPDFPQAYDPQSPLIKRLTDRCLLTETDTNNSSVAVCACIILGNYATNPSAAADIVSKIKLTELYDLITLKAYHRSRTSTTSLTVQDHADYLHSAAGLLRHLALSPEVKHKFFSDAAPKQTAIALAQYHHVEVQIDGLRLLRQLIIDDIPAFEQVISGAHHATLLKVFADEATDQRVKLEVARTFVALLRTAAKPELLGNSAVSTLLDAKDVLAPPAYATKSKLPMARAEGWLGLCLAIRASPRAGSKAVSELLVHDKELTAALRAQITGEEDKGADAAEAEEEHGALPLQGEKTGAVGAVQGKARDNAIVLLSEVLKSEGIDDGVRDELDSIAAEAGITLRL